MLRTWLSWHCTLTGVVPLLFFHAGRDTWLDIFGGSRQRGTVNPFDKIICQSVKIILEISSLLASIQGKMSVMLLGKNGPLICLCEERLEYWCHKSSVCKLLPVNEVSETRASWTNSTCRNKSHPCTLPLQPAVTWTGNQCLCNYCLFLPSPPLEFITWVLYIS